MRLNQTFLETLAAAVAEKIDTTEIERLAADDVSVSGDDVLEAAVESVTDGIRDHDIIESAVEKLIDQMDHDDITETAAEKLADNIDSDDIAEKVASELVDRLVDSSDFMESIADLLAEKILASLMEPTPQLQAVEPEPIRESRVVVETTPTASGMDLAGGAVACLHCGGALFMHRNGTCPVSEVVA